jgi:hypothetical protein
MFYSTTLIFTASLATLALAKTDLSGCTSTDVSSPAGASIAYYVPGTGEVCEFLDCGGGRAPPKTTVPGCPSYEGTLTYSPSFLPGYGSATAGPSDATSTNAALTTDEYESSTSSEVAPIYSDIMTAPDSTMSTMSMSTITSGPVAPVAGNGTTIVTAGSTRVINAPQSGSGNGTVTSGSPSASPITSDSGAKETARVWASGAGLMGLGAIVLAL